MCITMCIKSLECLEIFGKNMNVNRVLYETWLNFNDTRPITVLKLIIYYYYLLPTSTKPVGVNIKEKC